MAATATETKGTAWLAEYIEEKTGKTLKPYDLRTILRRLTASGEIEREEGRYEFTGERDSRVKAVLAAVKAGGEPKAKAEPAAKKAPAKKAAAKKTTSRRKKAEPVEELDEDEDLELDEI